MALVKSKKATNSIINNIEPSSIITPIHSISKPNITIQNTETSNVKAKPKQKVDLRQENIKYNTVTDMDLDGGTF